MVPRAAARVLLLASALGLGCAHGGASTGTPVVAPQGGAWIVVPRVTLYAQRGENDCGPAALATLLARWGATAPPKWRQATADAPRGASAGALRDEARRLGFQSFVFAGTFDDLASEIAAGRPVMVGLVRNKGQERLSHFSVVVGHEAGGARWLLADPATGVGPVTRAALDQQWAAAGFVTLVLYPGGGAAQASL